MGFQIDMSPLERSSRYIGQSLANAGQSIGGALVNSQSMTQQAQQQQDSEEQVQDLLQRSMSGDSQAFQELIAKSPQAARMVAEQLQGQKETQQGDADRLSSQMANDTAGFIEQMHLAPIEQQEAMFNAAIDDPRYDIDEEDRNSFMDTNARKAIIGQVKGKDYAETLFGGKQGKDSNFAPQVSSIQTDQKTGQKYVTITDRNTKEVKRVDAKDAIGETLTQEQDREFRGKSLDDARVISKNSFDELRKIKSAIGTMDEAIKAIDEGAQSGAIDRWLPSFKESTLSLENAAQRMGLDVISATTFGALSEGELRLAMDTALPSKMQPKELRKWLTQRKKAKNKLARELSKMAVTLGKGKTTIAEYIEGNATFGGNIEDISDEDLFN